MATKSAAPPRKRTQADTQAQASPAPDTPAATNPMRVDTPQAARPASKKSPYSRPVFTQCLNINHQQAQNIFERSFGHVARALYSIDVVLRIIGKQEDIDEVDAIIQKDIERMFSEIDKHTAQLSQLMDDNGVDGSPEYTNPKEYVVQITCPQVARFVQLLKRMDAMLIRLDTAWLNGLIGSSERIELTREQRNKLNGLATRLIQIEIRARNAAKAQGKGAELENAVPTENQSTDSTSVAEAETAQAA